MWCAKRTCLYTFLIASCLQVFRCQQYVGDLCYHNVKRASGVCKVITDCQNAMSDLRRGVVPQNCGFQGSLPVVCCVGGSPPTITTTTTTTTTTTKPTKSSLKVGERSLQKCDEYKIHAYVEEYSPLLTFNTATQLRNDCPFDKVKLIIGGERAKPKEFPHMALVGFDEGDKKIWDCGGTLISENYVLTAAHCLYSQSYGNATTIRLGEMNQNDAADDVNVQQIRIKRAIPHPGYIRPSRYNDIALFHLETPATLGIYVRPACLYTKRRSDTTSAIASGWGFTEDGNKSDWLMKVVLGFFTPKRCNVTYAGDSVTLNRGIDDESQLCAGSFDEEKDTCQGDSGGPFQIYSDTYCMYDIIGLTSFGKSCGFEGIPAVYTRVYPYLKWIEDIVWP